MNKEDLLIYELPLIAEFVFWGWLQSIIAKKYANRVNKKYKRYLIRKVRRNEYLKTNITKPTN